MAESGFFFCSTIHDTKKSPKISILSILWKKKYIHLVPKVANLYQSMQRSS